MTKRTPPMTSVQRAFEIVDTLWELREAGPSKVADHLGLSKSTAHVYLRSLESTGYVVNDGGKYRLSYQFLTTGSEIKYRSRIFQISKHEIKSLAEVTDELVVLFVEEMGELVLLHQAETEQSLDLGTYPGMTLPLHSHASGKVFLAEMSPDRRQSILDDGLTTVTDQTITDRARLHNELERIRQEGYAFDWDQQITGMGVVAVPITVGGDLKAVLSIAAPTGKIQDETYRTELRQRLQETVDTLTIKYRYGT